MAEECDENDYHFDLDSYKPVQPITFDHGVALFPVAAPHSGMDLHLLQVNVRFTIYLLYLRHFLSFFFSSFCFCCTIVLIIDLLSGNNAIINCCEFSCLECMCVIV